MSDRLNLIFESDKPSRAIVKIAVPATLALLAKAIYNIVDTVYIGMLGSDTSLAAVGVTLPILLIMVSVENIFSAGAAVLAGRYLGANKRKDANMIVTSVFILSAFIGIALCVCADILTIIVCYFSIKPMKEISKENLRLA